MDRCPQPFQVPESRLERERSAWACRCWGTGQEAGPRRTNLAACPARAGPSYEKMMGALLRLELSVCEGEREIVCGKHVNRW